MKTVNIRKDASINNVPAIIPFQGVPSEEFVHGEEIMVQLINDDGEKVGSPEIRSVVKTHDADEKDGAWYEAFMKATKV